MPVYVYRNMKTGETFEVEQRMTDDALTTDPRTGDPVRRVIQPVGIAFKGSGFYVNDSRGSSRAASSSTAASESGPAASETPAAPAASESSPAAGSTD